MNVISLKDYAAQKNISYEAVRQQVVRYKDELEGHIIRDGRQQFLDEEAVAFLDAKRQKNPVAIIQQSKDETIEELENQVKQLLVKTAAQADRISELAEWKAENALLIAGAEQTRLALEAAEQRESDAQKTAQEALQSVAQLQKEHDDEVHLLRQELSGKEERLRVAEEYAEACRAYAALPGWKRMITKPPVAPEGMK